MTLRNDFMPPTCPRAKIFSGMTTWQMGSPQVAVVKRISLSGAISQPQVLQPPAAICSTADPSGLKR